MRALACTGQLHAWGIGAALRLQRAAVQDALTSREARLQMRGQLRLEEGDDCRTRYERDLARAMLDRDRIEQPLDNLRSPCGGLCPHALCNRSARCTIAAVGRQALDTQRRDTPRRGTPQALASHALAHAASRNRPPACRCALGTGPRQVVLSHAARRCGEGAGRGRLARCGPSALFGRLVRALRAAAL